MVGISDIVTDFSTVILSVTVLAALLSLISSLKSRQSGRKSVKESQSTEQRTDIGKSISIIVIIMQLTTLAVLLLEFPYILMSDLHFLLRDMLVFNNLAAILALVGIAAGISAILTEMGGR